MTSFGTDHFEEDWAQAIPFLPVDGGTVAGCIVPIYSRALILTASVLVHNLTRYREKLDGTAFGHARVWENLLVQLDYLTDPSRAAVIIDWLDKDDSAITPSGAESVLSTVFMNPPRFPAQ